METDHALPAPWPHRLCDETLKKGREASFAAFELSNPPTIVRLHLLSFTWTSPCTIDERAHTEPPSDQSAFPISLVIRNSLSLESPIADLERPDLTLIELTYRPSALYQKKYFSRLAKPTSLALADRALTRTRACCGSSDIHGGGRGIRTPGGLSPTTVFKFSAIPYRNRGLA